MRVLCAYSGIEFSCDHVPGFLSSREDAHPIFTLPPGRILSYAGKWAAGHLTTTDSYLVFLAGIYSTELVEFRVPVLRTPKTDSLIAQNMQRLFSVLSKLDVIKNPSFAVPRYVISPETKDLQNVRFWLESWLQAYDDFQKGYKSLSLNQAILQKERALERLIKNAHRTVSSYTSLIADWAALAGDFPTFTVNVLNSEGKPQSCAEYWKSLIVACGKKEALWKVSSADLAELIEHCEDNIDHGSIYSHALMKYLRESYEEITNPLGFGAPLGTKFTILDDKDTVEEANLLAIISNAPEDMPRKEQYPTSFAYLKAKMAWDMAQRRKPASTEIVSSPASSPAGKKSDKFDL